jgi:mono/diheme cytochrome c family protein
MAVPAAVLYGAEKKESKGAKLFRQHCVACHPDA